VETDPWRRLPFPSKQESLLRIFRSGDSIPVYCDEHLTSRTRGDVLSWQQRVTVYRCYYIVCPYFWYAQLSYLVVAVSYLSTHSE
jgi:hypothetical protein